MINIVSYYVSYICSSYLGIKFLQFHDWTLSNSYQGDFLIGEYQKIMIKIFGMAPNYSKWMH